MTFLTKIHTMLLIYISAGYGQYTPHIQTAAYEEPFRE
jgi:hypothetical protein